MDCVRLLTICDFSCLHWGEPQQAGSRGHTEWEPQVQVLWGPQVQVSELEGVVDRVCVFYVYRCVVVSCMYCQNMNSFAHYGANHGGLGHTRESVPY